MRALERAEIGALELLFRMAPPAPAAELGLASASRDGTLLVRAARADVLALNRAAGLGVFAPPSHEQIAAALAWFDEGNIPRAFVQVTPELEGTKVPEWLAAHGLKLYNNWVRLARDASPVEPPDTSLRVAEAGRGDRTAFGEIIAEAFGWPTVAGAWATGPMGHPSWHYYLAFDGDAPVATASLYVDGTTGWFGMAATRESARGRGAQTALIARRINDAAALGCTLLSIETAEPTPQREAPSFRNVTRAGFEIAYTRANWIFRRTG